MIIGDDAPKISELKFISKKSFKQKIWDSVQYLLGIEIARSKKRFFSLNKNMYWICF